MTGANKMRMPGWCDEYEIKARYIPVFLSVMPVAHLLLQVFGGAFLKGKRQNAPAL